MELHIPKGLNTGEIAEVILNLERAERNIKINLEEDYPDLSSSFSFDFGNKDYITCDMDLLANEEAQRMVMETLRDYNLFFFVSTNKAE